MRKASALLVVVTLLTPGVARAQEPRPDGPVTLTLAEAIDRGTATSHRVREGEHRSAAADAAADVRLAATRPRVAAHAGYTRTNHVDEFGVPLPNNQLRVIYPDIPDNYRARLEAEWLLYDGGRLRALERVGRSEAAAIRLDLRSTRADLVLEITRAYWQFVTAVEAADVVAEALEQIGAHLRDVRNQLEVGLVTPGDVFSVEAQEARQRMLQIQAQTARDVAQSELARLVGLPIGTTVVASSAVESAAVELPPHARLVEIALERSPEREALAQRVAAGRERERAAAAARRPSVGVLGGIDYARPNPRIFPRQETWAESWDAGINVSWPLFDGGRARAEQTEASALRLASQARLAEFDEVLALRITQHLAEVASARAAIAAAESGVRAAGEARRVAAERFAAGVSASTDVLDAQVALLQAALDRTSALANARLAAARLERTLGR